MMQLERQIKTTQRRLWLNRWFGDACRCLGGAALAFGALVLVQRLFDLPMPIFIFGAALGSAGLTASIILTLVRREDAAVAAAALDRAAGLRERISSGRHCLSVDDPFAQAVVVDAERVSSSLSARRHIPLEVPRPLAFSIFSLIVSASMFLISPGALKSTAAKESDSREKLLNETKVAVKRKLDQVRKIAETVPALQDLEEGLKDLDKKAGGELRRPDDVRHEAVKKIDAVADAVKKKRADGDYDGVKEMRKMMRALKSPESPTAPTQKLTKALQQGDVKTAIEEIKALKEMLATLQFEKDKELAENMSKQLDELAKQLDAVAKKDPVSQKLAQAGLKKEDVERLLEQLKKKDLDQVKKQLEEKGLSPEQIEKLAQQLQQQQKAGSVAQKLAEGMKQAAQGAGSGQMGEAMAGLSMAEGQLGELEQLEQEMNQLDAALAELNNARTALDKPCGSCGGTGCSQCQGAGGNRGSGMGMKVGQGRGGLAPEEETAVDFKTERAKVHTGKGAIIGQFLVDGEQAKGEVSTVLAEVATAAERDASDRINRDRVPRQYQKAVKAYFSTIKTYADNPDGQPAAGDGSGTVDDDGGE